MELDIITIVFYISLVVGLLYLSIFDLKFKEIPYVPLLILSTVSLAYTIFLLLTNQGGLTNILTGLAMATFIGIIVVLTKEKAMGSGDIYIAFIMGAFLGFPNVIAGFYVAISLATIYGLSIALKTKKFKGVAIPFVPFISIGIVVGLFFGDRILNLLIPSVFV